MNTIPYHHMLIAIASALTLTTVLATLNIFGTTTGTAIYIGGALL